MLFMAHEVVKGRVLAYLENEATLRTLRIKASNIIKGRNRSTQKGFRRQWFLRGLNWVTVRTSLPNIPTHCLYNYPIPLFDILAQYTQTTYIFYIRVTIVLGNDTPCKYQKNTDIYADISDSDDDSQKVGYHVP